MFEGQTQPADLLLVRVSCHLWDVPRWRQDRALGLISWRLHPKLRDKKKAPQDINTHSRKNHTRMIDTECLLTPIYLKVEREAVQQHLPASATCRCLRVCETGHASTIRHGRNR